MSNTARLFLYLFSAAIFGVFLTQAMAGLPGFGRYPGPYGDLVTDSMRMLRHTQQAVAAVTFDYRGFDTLGEEYILFSAVAGALLLMRPQESEKSRKKADRASDRVRVEPATAVVVCGMLMFPFALLLGIYVVLHGHLTPGGGFQGGVLLASAFYFVYLSAEYDELLEFVSGHAVASCEIAGAAGFLLLGALPLLHRGAYLQNTLPLGETGALFSAGSLPLFNCAVGAEVAAGFLLVISAFLRQLLVISKGKRR